MGSVDSNLGKVDHSSLRVNQALIIILLLAAFILNLPVLAAIVAVLMLGGAIIGRPGFFFIYTLVLRPIGLVKPHVIPDNPEPHRFAQGFGGVVTAASAVSLLLGNSALGWILSWVVVALAALNLFAGFCAGCAVYYWLRRLNIPGFTKNPPAGVFPGMRPRS